MSTNRHVTIASRYLNGESIRQIAADLGRSYTYVHDALIAAQVPLRPPGGTYPRPYQPPRAANPDHPTRHTPTNAEVAVLYHLADGVDDDATIAARTGLTPDAVNTTRHHIRNKLHATTDAHAIAVAYRHQLLRPTRDPGDLPPLNDAELIVLRLLARGADTATITTNLRVPDRVAAQLLRRLFAKLDVPNATSAVAAICRHRLQHILDPSAPPVSPRSPDTRPATRTTSPVRRTRQPRPEHTTVRQRAEHPNPRAEPTASRRKSQEQR